MDVAFGLRLLLASRSATKMPSFPPGQVAGHGVTGQESTIWRFWLKELGIKMVFIDPHFNFTAITQSDKWLAPRPGTDAAIAAAIAYVWITENTYDKDYIEKHGYGFEKWQDYVLGKEDGVPKTPEWAEVEAS